MNDDAFEREAREMEWEAAGAAVEREDMRRWRIPTSAIIAWAAGVTVSVLDTLEGA